MGTPSMLRYSYSWFATTSLSLIEAPSAIRVPPTDVSQGQVDGHDGQKVVPFSADEVPFTVAQPAFTQQELSGSPTP